MKKKKKAVELEIKVLTFSLEVARVEEGVVVLKTRSKMKLKYADGAVRQRQRCEVEDECM